MGYYHRNVLLLHFKADHKRTSQKQKRNRNEHHCSFASGSGSHHALSAGFTASSCGLPCYFILFSINFSSYLPVYDRLEALLHESGGLPALLALLTGDYGIVRLFIFPDWNRKHSAGNIFHPVLYLSASTALPQSPGPKKQMEIRSSVIKYDKKGKCPEERNFLTGTSIFPGAMPALLKITE